MTHLKLKPELMLLDNAAWPVFLVDEGGTLRHANQAAVSFFGPRLEGDSTQLSVIWATENEFNAQQFLARWDRSAHAIVPLKFRGKGGVTTPFSVCLSSSSRDGLKRYLFQLFRDAPGMAATATPAGEPAKATEGNLAQKQKLDCALQLTRSVALDFNNALSGILGHASLVLSQMPPDHPWRKSLVEVEKAAQKGAEVAQHLAAFSRPEQESQDLAAGNLNSVLRRVTETFQASRPEGIRWSLQLYNNLNSVRFDEAKVQQAFVKVIENAVEATGGEGTIGVETRNVDLAETVQDGTLQLPPGAYVCVEVTDDGPGIEPEVLPRIFEPFYTTKAAHRGLGLAWVYGVITNHGGGVALSSMPGQGTSVRIYLPAGKAAAPDTRIRGALACGEKTLLFVDDEELVLTMGQAILESQGYRVLAANTGEKALEILARHEAPIDLVITDLVMPQMSGRELIEQIRFFCPDTPIICTSGYVRPASPEDQAIYLQKPFTAQELLRRVSETLETAEAA